MEIHYLYPVEHSDLVPPVDNLRQVARLTPSSMDNEQCERLQVIGVGEAHHWTVTKEFERKPHSGKHRCFALVLFQWDR